ncbi:hypothetical protein POX_c04555 [Penicillium oxalicum]|uniref:hypothetical protein n=1 Tax=Penicillium oxalicum TaxID=69781 RepID=UPI0020B68A6B|nr:hypothetical protein POX_c04555 [Penicillium oxalicum]KAI2791686.1 hypothetical protein POX_c04555 [Penicillium oxalicum]
MLNGPLGVQQDRKIDVGKPAGSGDRFREPSMRTTVHENGLSSTLHILGNEKVDNDIFPAADSPEDASHRSLTLVRIKPTGSER